MFREGLLVSIFCLLACIAYSENSTKVLEKVHLDQSNKPSLQRGAKYFINYCSGCHDLGHMRYNALGQGIKLFNEDDELDEKLLKDSLIFPNHKIGDLITGAMPVEDAKNWFGKAPPDLTLEARVRGSDWIYNFLLGFYYDPSKPRNVNNLVFPDVGMPHILQPLEGIKIPIYETSKNLEIAFLEPYQPGQMTEQQYRAVVYDITNFLTYVSEPMRATRLKIGWWVLGFLVIFTILAYLLKCAYWEDID